MERNGRDKFVRLKRLKQIFALDPYLAIHSFIKKIFKDKDSWPEKSLWIILISIFFVMLISLYPAKALPPVMHYKWYIGYWQISPGIGMTRIIPITGPFFISPAAGADAKEIRDTVNY